MSDEVERHARVTANAIARAIRVGFERYFPVGAHRNANHAEIETAMASAAHTAIVEGVTSIQAEGDAQRLTERPETAP